MTSRGVSLINQPNLGTENFSSGDGAPIYMGAGDSTSEATKLLAELPKCDASSLMRMTSDSRQA
jgi:hypothetical protein